MATSSQKEAGKQATVRGDGAALVRGERTRQKELSSAREAEDIVPVLDPAALCRKRGDNETADWNVSRLGSQRALAFPSETFNLLFDKESRGKVEPSNWPGLPRFSIPNILEGAGGIMLTVQSLAGARVLVLL